MDLKRLNTYLEHRPEQLKDLKQSGTKVIGYFPGNYVPEELIYASGAVPLCLINGGNPAAAETGLSVFPQIICPFARSQVGERLLNQKSIYNMLDMVVAPITCQHLKKVAEFWEYTGELEIFKLGVPHQRGGDTERDYFAGRLKALKDRLEAFTKNEITDEKIIDSIRLYNRMRELIKEISRLRQNISTPVNFMNFLKLNHASFFADPEFMVDFLESVYQELKVEHVSAAQDSPRILLIGPNIGYGDYRVPELIMEAGGEIVIEEICEGTRYYWRDIDHSGDLFQSLARGYLEERVPCAYMRNSTRTRFDFSLKLIEDFAVDGVIWYEILCCETYDAESYYYVQKLAERDIPMLILESDYGTGDTSQMKTRIEAFIEIVKGVF